MSECWYDHWISVRSERVKTLQAWGFNERQARFLVHVLVFSGVFLERQYCQAVGIVHGQKSHDFIRRLIAQGYVTPITPGSLRRGRMYHVQYKPFYEAIGGRDNRHRKATTVGRLIRRLMLLDAVLSDDRYYWLGTERDKFRYFDQVMKRDIPRDWYPHIVFQHEESEAIRLFPEKLPIGVAKDGRDHVFLYLATRPHPWDFRLFLLRHQRWRERPRCRDRWVALALSEAGSFTPSLVRVRVTTLSASLSGRCAPPACPELRLDRPETRGEKQDGKWSQIRNHGAPTCASSCACRSGPISIASVSLMPCSPSSMLCAPLRPGQGPGLRALTTPLRGTVLALARCWRFLDVDDHLARARVHEVDAPRAEA